ncbi:MAG: FHA domain-containing protein [Lentisphaeraceae bacterium]|nr:FHA domain-containing protein [Lentisphaeraceae bacterium]
MNETVNSYSQATNQNIGVADTVGPQNGLTHREILEPETPRMKPSFFIYEKNRVRQVDINNEESIFKIGKGQDCDITLDDNTISDTQVSVIRMGEYCYFMDCGTKDRVTFNGVTKRQEVSLAETRMIMKIGNTWVVYIGIDAANFDDTDSIVLKRSLINSTPQSSTPEAEILLKSNFGEWYSDSAPILVGTHSSCDYKISGDNIQPYHFLISYGPQGVFIEDMTHGKPGIKVDGLNCIGIRPIKDDITINIGKLAIYLYAYGDIKERCRTLFHNYNPKADLALSALSEHKNKSINLPRTNEKLTIGRSSDSNIIIPDDPSISRIHAYMVIRDKCLFLEDNQSHNKTYVNLKPITKTSVLPGDIIEFGDSAFLLHYQN